jgi:uncharacterized membrane protein
MATHARDPAASEARGKAIKMDCTITINRPPDELYRFWLNFENLPYFMSHLRSVRRIDELHSRWVAAVPAGLAVEWDAAVHHVIPNQLIAWRSLAGAELHNMGSVTFRPSPRGRGTEMRVVLSYETAAGKLGHIFAKLLSDNPKRQVCSDLRRFKALLETGEIPTIAGQPSGRWEAQRRVENSARPDSLTPTERIVDPAWDPVLDPATSGEGRTS